MKSVKKNKRPRAGALILTQKMGHRMCGYNTRDMNVRKSKGVERMG